MVWVTITYHLVDKYISWYLYIKRETYRDKMPKTKSKRPHDPRSEPIADKNIKLDLEQKVEDL